MNGLSEKYSEYVDYLKTTRLELSTALSELEESEYQLALAKAKAEKNFIDVVAAGKPKALGSNAEDRTRALLVAIEDDSEYKSARKRYRDAQLNVNKTKAEKESVEDKLKLISLESDNYLRDAIREIAIELTKLTSR